MQVKSAGEICYAEGGKRSKQQQLVCSDPPAHPHPHPSTLCTHHLAPSTHTFPSHRSDSSQLCYPGPICMHARFAAADRPDHWAPLVRHCHSRVVQAGGQAGKGNRGLGWALDEKPRAMPPRATTSNEPAPATEPPLPRAPRSPTRRGETARPKKKTHWGP